MHVIIATTMSCIHLFLNYMAKTWRVSNIIRMYHDERNPWSMSRYFTTFLFVIDRQGGYDCRLMWREQQTLGYMGMRPLVRQLEHARCT